MVRTPFAVLLLFMATLLRAQVRETIEVRVLELEAAVLDRHGTPVDGLTRDDFEVRVENRIAEVTNFYAVRRGVMEEAAPVGPEVAATALPATTSMPLTLVIFVDDTRLTPRGKARAIEALTEYVRNAVGAPVTAMLVRWNGSLDIRTRPGDRPGPLLLELDAIAHQPGHLNDSERRQMLRWIDEFLASSDDEDDVRGGNRPRIAEDQLWRLMLGHAEREAREVDRTLDALRETIRLAAGFEGRKALLYVGEGLPRQPGAELFSYWERAQRASATHTDVDPHMMERLRRATNHLDPLRFDRSRSFQKLATDAQRANIAFYAVDAGGVRGLEGQTPADETSFAQVDTFLIRSNAEDGLRFAATETGGRYIAHQNDLGKALLVVSEQFTTWYSLGVRAGASTRLSKVRIAVKGRPELRVIAARQRATATREQQIERSVRSRLYSLRAENLRGAALSVGTPANLGGKCVVPLKVSMPSPGAEMWFVLLDSKMQESEVRTVSIAMTDHTMSLGLKPDRYVLSIGLAQRATGEMAWLQTEIDATCR